MPCYRPMLAYQDRSGVRIVGSYLRYRENEEHISHNLVLPCGKCLGCQMDKSRHWAIRCILEDQEHAYSCWTTLTYDDDALPPTLRPKHLSEFHKRLRSHLARLHAKRRSALPRECPVPDGTGTTKIKTFACGEYGDERGRPHYHSILFGVPESTTYGVDTHNVVQQNWPHGQARVHTLRPEAIAYVAGYCNKKTGRHHADAHELVDAETGECYRYQPPFLQMSRRPGIGDKARSKYTNSWRDTAIWHGVESSVPRYLHQSWIDTATEEELQRQQEKIKAKAYQLMQHRRPAQLRAALILAHHRHQRQQEARKL